MISSIIKSSVFHSLWKMYWAISALLGGCDAAPVLDSRSKFTVYFVWRLTIISNDGASVTEGATI